MRFLLDANLSPEAARRLKISGHDAVHVGEFGLLTASDPEIMEAAAEADRILVTADSDFAAMLALGEARSPSVILLRSPTTCDRLSRRPSWQPTSLRPVTTWSAARSSA